MPDGMSEYISDRMRDGASNTMPSRMPERMSEYMSDRMPERQTSRIHAKENPSWPGALAESSFSVCACEVWKEEELKSKDGSQNVLGIQDRADSDRFRLG